MIKKHYRTDRYLEKTLNSIWSQYFPDIQKYNRVNICFGYRAKKRLGSIRRHNIDRQIGLYDTLILINGHFRDPEIPAYIIKATIAHELCHYAHGISSPLPQTSKFPHRGGRIDQEMELRGLSNLEKMENTWLSQNWYSYLDEQKALQ